MKLKMKIKWRFFLKNCSLKKLIESDWGKIHQEKKEDTNKKILATRKETTKNVIKSKIVRTAFCHYTWKLW